MVNQKITGVKTMKCPKCGYESTEPKPENEKEPLINKLISITIFVAIVFLLISLFVVAVSHLSYIPDEISYNSKIYDGSPIVGSYNSNILFFQEDEVWYMIITEITENGTVNNSLPYHTYYWNGTRWVLK